MSDIPAAPGTYAVQMRIPRSVRLQIGRLGMFEMPPAGYLYLGSAFGSGGLRARTGRYLLDVVNTHWHIDYLLPSARIERIYFAVTNHPLECLWSQKLSSLPDARLPVAGFGASDCKADCKAHLVLLPNPIEETILQQLQDVSKPFKVKTWGRRYV